MLEKNKIHCMHALHGLKSLPDECIDIIVTSPPFWALRDYGLKPVVWGGNKDCKHSWRAFQVVLQTRGDNSEKLSEKQKSNRGSSQVTSKGSITGGEVCGKCDAWRGQLGLEPEITLYIQHLCELFSEAFRVLKRSGTLWVNLGDTYAGSWGGYGHGSEKSIERMRSVRLKRPDSRFRPASSWQKQIQKKCMCLIPERFVIEMVSRGWILRNKIIWHKPNHMPASVKDRFANSWEYLFLFVKSRKYYFDLDAVREPHKCLSKSLANKGVRKKKAGAFDVTGKRMPPEPSEQGAFHAAGKNPGDFWTVTSETRSLGAIVGKSGAVKVPGGSGWTGHPSGGAARILRENDLRWLSPNRKNPGDVFSVSPQAGKVKSWAGMPENNHSHKRKNVAGTNKDFWSISTQPFKGAHFATYPESLVERAIKTSPLFVCNKCRKPRERITETERVAPRNNVSQTTIKAKQQDKKIAQPSVRYDAVHITKGWSSCKCNVGFKSALVLDPFVGSGTTAVAASKLGRDFIGLELNPDYVKLADVRLANAIRKQELKGGSSQKAA